MENKGATLVSASGSYATWCCSNCQNMHRIPVDDELELSPCEGSDDCHAKVCGSCESRCEYCGNLACSKHIRSGEFDGTHYERICDICVKEIALDDNSAPQCDYCGEPSGDLVEVDDSDSSVGYNSSLMLCQSCRSRSRNAA